MIEVDGESVPLCAYLQVVVENWFKAVHELICPCGRDSK